MWSNVKDNISNSKDLIFICIILLVGFLILISIDSNISDEFGKKDKETYKEIVFNDIEQNAEKEDPVDKGNNYIDELKNTYNNDDIVSILKIEGANLNEIVLQGKDNNYYLSHNINKEYDKYGSTYMDYRINLDESKKILIFGHNSSYVSTPFQELENYYDKQYYETHKYITLQTEKEIRTYEIFSVYIETSDWTYMNLNFSSEGEWNSHFVKLKNKSLYDTKVEVSGEDEILILQTCSNNKNYSSYKKKYLLIISRRV